MQKLHQKSPKSSSFWIRSRSLSLFGSLAIIVIQLSLFGVEKEYISRLKKRTSDDDKKDEIKARPCRDLEELTTGAWNNETKEWVPSTCKFIPYTQNTLNTCFHNKTIGFYGDSTLYEIAEVMRAMASRTDDTLIPLDERGMPNRLDEQLGGQGRLTMWWTSSAYPTSNRWPMPYEVESFATEDVSVISISVWDMGWHYKGVNTWFWAIHKLLKNAAKTRIQKPIYVLNIHHLYPSKCQLKHNTRQGKKRLEVCKTCNTEESRLAFRDALETAIACLHQSGYTNLILVDHSGVTNSSFAEERSDGVHYHPWGLDTSIVTMEVQVLLSAICGGLKPPQSSKKCDPYADFEEGKTFSCVPQASRGTKITQVKTKVTNVSTKNLN